MPGPALSRAPALPAVLELGTSGLASAAEPTLELAKFPSPKLLA
jgi:hypothetical protein